MQEILDALGPLSIANVAALLVLLWGPGLAITAIPIYVFYQQRKALPRELVVVVIGFFLSISFIPLMAVWQSFEALSLESWAKLTGVELAVCLAVIAVARQALKGGTPQAAHHLAADWNRGRHIWAVVLPLIGLLVTVTSTRSFIAYMQAEAATAVMISQKHSPRNNQVLINAEWDAPDGKKTPVMLFFDQRDAFRPKLSPGLLLPFRLDAREAAAGKTDPVYTIDIGMITELLGYLSTLVFALGALLAGLMMRREKKS